ncbi:MAG: hypothetical protein CM15mP66_06070 [Pseudomonadota bacterium]|jgi:hypothetical protein|nr:MAG: hypothetical protein CM15mP66_06070 [Pseudomonadota bacterium]|tara:strand:+ start:365 stop:496 length:132 start_codon:yes stop_codon:yes gene_type:complete
MEIPVGFLKNLKSSTTSLLIKPLPLLLEKTGLETKYILFKDLD